MRRAILVAIGLLTALTACGVPIRTGTTAPPAMDASAGLTFAWNQGRDRIIGDPRLQDNRFFEDRLHEAVEWELSLRGIHRVDASPDLLVHHHLTLEDHEQAVESIDEAGYTTSEVYTYEGGTVVVHLVRAAGGQDFWLGWAQADIEPALEGPENMRTWVYDLVRVMFRSWPVPARSDEE
jgi:hypothetical protein